MRKLLSLILAAALSLGLVCACAEQEISLAGSWKLLFAFEDSAIDE